MIDGGREREREERERNLTFERKREREIGKGTQRRGGFYPNKLIREKTRGGGISTGKR